MRNKYKILEWGPATSGKEVAKNVDLSTCISIVQGFIGESTAQVFSLAWGHGYVATWQDGSASAKCFAGCNSSGFGGTIPEDAKALVEALTENRQRTEIYCAHCGMKLQEVGAQNEQGWFICTDCIKYYDENGVVLF